MDGMKQHAAAQGKSVEQWIRDLLNKVAKERNSHEN